jgi:hypothetical protein
MSKHAQGKGRISSKKIRRLVLVTGIVAVLALGATAAVSLRATDAKNSAKSSANAAGQPQSVQANATSASNIAKAARANLAGAPIPLDPQTGQVRPLTQEEAERLAASIKELVNQSTDGLQAVKHPDGTISMDLQGRFQSMVLTKRDENGEWVTACVDNRAAAAAFLGIDPQLVGVKKDATAPKATPNANSTAQPKGELR